MSRSSVEYRRAQRVIPGGVSVASRSFKSVGGTPRVIQSAAGCRLQDVDGKAYIDYIGGGGSAIAGHAHPAVVEAVQRSVKDGVSSGASSELETQLVEEIIDRVPGKNPSAQRVRFVNSAAEAVLTAAVLARATTKRNKIIRYDGVLHDSSARMLGREASDVLVLPFNDLEATRTAVTKSTGEIAAVLVEPVGTFGLGVVPPTNGFLQGLRELADRHGFVLIFDESVTGFRAHRGGAQGLFGVTPDLAILGKIIGGGFSLGAIVGSKELLDQLTPSGSVEQVGNFFGNSPALAAGVVTLGLLNDTAYQQLELSASRLESGLKGALSSSESRGVVQRVGSLIGVYFGVDNVSSHRHVLQADGDTFRWLFSGLLDRGVHLPPSGNEPWCVSMSHDQGVIDQTVRAARETLAELRWAATPIGL